jgi:hypothetical protein
MAGRYSDTVYDRNAPGAQSAGEAYVSYGSNEERLVTQALTTQRMDVDPALLGAQANPAPARLFPPRFVGERTQPTIDDVVVVDRRYPDSSAQFSGTSGGYAGSSVPSIGWW